jgi:hypothetical protein
MAISLDKVPTDLRKDAEMTRVTLEKAGVFGERAKCALVIDRSGSMSHHYSSGAVQGIAEKVLALSTQFDDDGDIEVFCLESYSHLLGSLSINDYQGGIDRLFQGHGWGSTDYAGAIRAVREHYGLAQDGQRSQIPVFVAFLTDGMPDSRPAAEQELISAANVPIFWAFGGVGDKDPMVIPQSTPQPQQERRGMFGRRRAASPMVTSRGSQFEFLRSLDTLDGRKIDNASYFPAPTPEAVTIENLLIEYPGYPALARQAQLIG